MNRQNLTDGAARWIDLDRSRGILLCLTAQEGGWAGQRVT